MTVDRHRLAEARSLELHRLVAVTLVDAPGRLDEVRATLAEWRTQGSVDPRYLDAWQLILDLPLEEMLTLIVDSGERMTALRQVSPFAGFIDARTRWRVWAEVAERLGA